MHFKIRHNYPIGRAAFWQLFFDDKYNKQLYVDVLRFGLYEILDNDRHDDGSVERRLLLEPSVEIPDLVRKVVGQRVRYEERGHFDPATQEWSYRIIPMSVPDKVEMHGKIFLEEQPQGVTRIFEGDVHVHIRGLGRILEKLIVETTRTQYERASKFTDRFIADEVQKKT